MQGSLANSHVPELVKGLDRNPVGTTWRDLSETYGARTTCYNRFVRWRRDAICALRHERRRKLTPCKDVREHFRDPAVHLAGALG